jgi:outer membrane receptor protein involved in Fe transport
VVGASIEVMGSALETVAGPDGRFVVRGLLPGRRDLVVRAFGYRPERVTIEVVNGRSQWVVVRLGPRPAELEAVIVRGEREAVAPGVSVIERETIARSGARDLGELLEQEPGITILRRGGPGAPAVAAIRGGSSTEVLVLVDGVPVNSPLTGEADLSTVGLQAVERVRVLRGGQSVRYGPRALAGVIAVETRVPSGPELQAQLGAGSFGERSAAVSVGSQSPRHRASLGGLVALEWRTLDGDFRYQAPSVRGGGRTVRRNADAAALHFRSIGVWQRAAGHVRGRFEGFTTSRGMPGSVVQPSLAARQDQHRISGGLSTRWERGRASIAARVDAETQRAAFHDPRPPAGPAFDEASQVDAFRVEVGARTRLGPIALHGGSETRQLWFSSTMLSADAPSQQTASGAWVDGVVSWPLGVSWVSELAGGVRGDWSSHLDEFHVSPRVSFSLGTAHVALRISTGSSFSPPSLADQFFQEGVQARPNPGLGAERVRGELEGAFEWRAVRLGALRLDGEVAAYRSDVDGMILWFPDFQFVWRPENFDVQRRGVELSLGAWLPAVAVRGTVSRLHAEYGGRALSGQLVYRPSLTATLGADLEIAGIRTTVAARHVGERRTVAGSAINTLAAYWVMNLDLRKTVRVGNWTGEFSFGVANLFDAAAFMLVDYPAPGRSWRMGVQVRPWSVAERLTSSISD